MLTNRPKKLPAPSAIFHYLHLIIFMLISLAIATIAVADTSLISNEDEVPVRSGQSTEHKIISLLQKGATVTSLEEDGYWIRVRTVTGREGWVLKRYLSSSDAQTIDDAFSLPTDTNRKDEATSPIEEAQPETVSPKTIVPPDDKESLAPKEALPPVEENPVSLEQKLSTANKELEELRTQLTAVTIKNQDLQEDKQIKWFLAGGGVLIIGWIMGLITCRTRKRRPSLL